MTSAHSRPVHAALTRGNIARILPAATFEEAIARVIRSTSSAKIAAQTGISERRLHHYATDPANASGEHRGVPGRDVVPISLAAGRLDVVEWQARALGCELYPLIATPATPRPFLSRIAGFMREVSQVQGAAAEALADAAISAADRARVAEELREALAAGHALLDALERDVRKPNARAGR